MWRGLRFSQVNKIGIIVLSALAFLAIVVLAVHLHGPEMPASEREAAAELLLAHGESVRPDISWKIDTSRLARGSKFELVFVLTVERHALLIRSFSAMERAKFAASLCPKKGELLDKMAAYQSQIRIEITEGGKILTGASCPL
ncbi:MAG: hypothetical protein QF521_23000 [Alphaproteobacteria bacterium]|jgi:hypothetical protein|nr:hypothetical protein [Alphaproteobacteria bacterium]